ncbi:MAG: tRNA-specific 2-thiouridylase [Desulfobacteraceae bacterium]
MAPTIAIGLSGGIDSLVSALLLKQQYRNVFGIHFTTGYEDAPVDLTSMEKTLGISILSVDLRADFETRVVNYFVATYLGGKTPNPCLACNRAIKFGALFSAAADLGADFIATGHYAGTREENSGDTALFKGKDFLKEQSYFLSMLTRNQLNRTIFPLAEMTKQEVKQAAAEKGIAPPVKKESQDICFIRKKNVADFIASKTGTPPRPGEIVTRDNKVPAKHLVVPGDDFSWPGRGSAL